MLFNNQMFQNSTKAFFLTAEELWAPSTVSLSYCDIGHKDRFYPPMSILGFLFSVFFMVLNLASQDKNFLAERLFHMFLLTRKMNGFIKG